MADQKKVKLWKRIVMSVGGVLVLAFAVTMYKYAALGIDPYSSLVAGLDELIPPLEYGTVYLMLGGILIILILFIEKKYIGLTTFINLFLVGYIVEWGEKLLGLIMPNPQMWVRILLLVFGILILCFGLAMIISGNLGISPYDTVSLIIVNKWNVGKLSYMRIVTDTACILLGTAFFLLGGGKLRDIPAIVGVGTVISAFFTGPLIAFFTGKVTGPLLYGQRTNDKSSNKT